jgi:hypothetical protein
MRQEPLFHFLGIAALLFVGNALFSGDNRELIFVDAATQEYLIQQQQDLLLRDMTDAEKVEIVQSFIDDEILVREARKRGFESSSRIRALLLQNMRFFLASGIPKPSEDELRAYVAENIERFSSPPSTTYQQVFFSDPDAVGDDTLERLRGGVDSRSLGDDSLMLPKRFKASERQIVATFGREGAPTILGLSDNLWHGPFTSASGVHFLRVAERHPGSRPDFEAARSWLEQEWTMQKNREIVADKLARLRESYRIEIQPPDQNPNQKPKPQPEPGS